MNGYKKSGLYSFNQFFFIFFLFFFFPPSMTMIIPFFTSFSFFSPAKWIEFKNIEYACESLFMSIEFTNWWIINHYDYHFESWMRFLLCFSFVLPKSFGWYSAFSFFLSNSIIIINKHPLLHTVLCIHTVLILNDQTTTIYR